MNRKEITAELSRQLKQYINPFNDPRIYYATEVTFDYATNSECRIDYMQFKPRNNSVSGIEQGLFIAYEIKSSVEDFNSGHGCNWHIADKSYLVTTEEVFAQIGYLLPHWVGCIAPDSRGIMRVIKNAKIHDRSKPINEILLMMFRSSNRELYKLRKELHK